MPEITTKSIVLYGNISQDANLWLNWYEYAVRQINETGFTSNYLGIIGNKFNSGKVQKLSRAEKKLKAELAQGCEISSLSIYSLPEDFKQAAFDYNIYFSRNLKFKNSHIILTFANEAFLKLDIQYIIDEAQKHIEMKSGQIFELSNFENPQIYASRVNSVSAFKTLKIIEEWSK